MFMLIFIFKIEFAVELKKADAIYLNIFGQKENARTFDQKIKELKESPLFQNQNGTFLFLFGIYKTKQQEYTNAIEYLDGATEFFRKAHDLTNSALSCYTKAKVLVKIAQKEETNKKRFYKDALDTLDKAIEIDNNNTRFPFRKIQILIEQKKINKAINDLLDLADRLADLQELGNTIECLKLIELIMPNIESVIELKKRNLPRVMELNSQGMKKEARYLLIQGEILFNKKEYEKAIDCLQKLLVFEHGHHEALRILSQCLMKVNLRNENKDSQVVNMWSLLD